MALVHGRQVETVTLEIAGRTLTIETGLLAEQAHGAVTVRYGDSMVLVAVSGEKEPQGRARLLPALRRLRREDVCRRQDSGRLHQARRTPDRGRDLAARLTDRPIRPLFPKGYRAEVQVISTVLSADQENDPDVLSIIGASAALDDLADSVRRPGRRPCASARSTARSSSIRPSSEIERQRTGHGRRRHRRRDHDGRRRGERDLRRDHARGHRRGPRRDQPDRRASARAARQRPARRSGRSRRPPRTQTLVRRGQELRRRPASATPSTTPTRSCASRARTTLEDERARAHFAGAEGDELCRCSQGDRRGLRSTAEGRSPRRHSRRRHAPRRPQARPRFARSGARSAICRARTARRSSPAARPRC